MKEAADACLKLGSDCSGVYDGQCNNAGAFKLCKAGTAFVGSASSCVYTPKAVATFKKVEKKHCRGNTYYTKVYTTLNAAQDACAALGSACSGVFDSGCNNVGLYNLCKSGNVILASETGCVYIPNTPK